MTSQRQSQLFALEGLTSAGKDNFGNGRGYHSNTSGGMTQNTWIAPPPGSYMSFTPNRNTSPIRTAGTKFWDLTTYGHFSGSWEWSFILDYNYLEPLMLVFDQYIPPAGDNGTHVFNKINTGRPPSFVIRSKVLNRMVGGTEDEMVERRGCVVRSVNFSKSSSNSQINVSMSGVYVNEVMLTGTLESTDYREYSGHAAEWMCMFIGAATNENYVANTESLSVGIGNNLYVNDNTCSPFSTSYGDGNSEFSFSTTCFSYMPSRYKQRIYTGGKSPEQLTNPTRYGPLSKNLAPMDLVTLMSYNVSANDTGTDIETAIAASTRKLQFSLHKCVLKSMAWQKGDGSKLQDQLSSVDCRLVSLTVIDTDTIDTARNNNLMTDPPNAVSVSADPAE